MTLYDIGIHPGVPEAVYHADCAKDRPSASSGALRTALDHSPEHAWFAHPLLNPAYEPKATTTAMDDGTILHSMILGTEPQFRVLNVKEYRSDYDKAQRDRTIADGLIPIKRARYDELLTVGMSLRNRLQQIPDVWNAIEATAESGWNEATMIFRTEDVLCRTRVDVLPPARFKAIYDFKFTGMSTEPGDFGKRIVSKHAVQSDLYSRGVQALRGDFPEMRFISCETDPPYGITIHALDPMAAEMAHDRVSRGLLIWRRCMETHRWPGYPKPVHYQSLTPWALKQWEQQRSAAAELEALGLSE